MTQKPVGSSRRSWLAAAGVALVTGGGGADAAMHRPADARAVLAPEETAFWAQKFSQVDGSSLSLATFKGKPLVLNFWATWCPPCLVELPLLDSFYSENHSKSWQVLGLAVDQLAPVKRFLARNPLSFPVAMAGFAGADLARSLGNLGGGLPFTVVFGPAGDVRHRKMGRLTPADLTAWKQMQFV